MWKRLSSAVRVLFRRRDFEAGLADEMQFHLEQYAADLVRSGMPADEAARRARAEFGNPHDVQVDCREARGLRLLDELARNLRYAVRTLLRTPGFTASTLATLALCLGSTFTILAVVDSVLLRPLPFPAAAGLVSIYNTYPQAGVPNDGCSLTNYYERRGRIAAFAGVSAYREGTAVVGGAGGTEREHVTRVSPDFFATLGLGPTLGRAFTEEETAYARSHVVILTHAYWSGRFNADPGIVGRTIRIDGSERTIVGVLPREFSFLSSKATLYVPLASEPEERSPRNRHSGNSDMIARLRPGVSVAQAQEQVDAHNAALESTNPDAPRMAQAGFRSVVVPLHADHVAGVRELLLLLQAGSILLLVLGTVNVTNLFLIRASGRAREFAVRQAIGATRLHMLREVLTETLLVAVVGGLLGLAVGAWGVGLLRSLGAEHLPLGARITFDARLAFVGLAGAIALGTAIAIPVAWSLLRVPSTGALHGSARGATAGRMVVRLRHGFVVVQVAMAFVLLSGAGLLALSLERVAAIFPGFRPGNVLTGQLTLPGRTYPDGIAILTFTDRMLAALASQPDVVASGFATNMPLSGISNKSAATARGQALTPGEPPRGIYSYGVGGDYFGALGYTLKAGRFLTSEDSRRSERTCVVDEAFVRRYWPDGRALGRQVFQGASEGPVAEAFVVVGVVGTAAQADVTEHEAMGAVYYPFAFRNDRNIFIVSRTRRSPEGMSNLLRETVRSLDPEMPVTGIQSMDGRIADSLVTRRSPALLATVFAAIALVLVAIGTYGVLSYAVSERRREIGLRMALGARPGQVLRQFLSSSLRLLAAGIAAGVAGTWLAGHALEAILYQVPAVHLATLAFTTAVVSAVSLAACLAPVRRAARTPPMIALAE